MRACLGGLVMVAVAWGGCTDDNILYCDANKPCQAPNRPFCDLRGEYGGQPHECIPTPAGRDGGSDAPGRDAGPDALTVLDAPDQDLDGAHATPDVDETLLFQALSAPSSTHNAPQKLSANGIEVSPDFVFYGESATDTAWKAAVGQTLALLGSGAAPLPQWGTPFLGAEDDSVKFQRGKYYESTDESLGKIADGDFVIETVFRIPEDLTSEEQFLGVGLAPGSDAGYALRFTPAGNLGFSARDQTGTGFQITSAALTPGTWNHALVVAHRSGSAQIYINGSTSGPPVNIAAVKSLSTPSGRLALGAQSNGGAQGSGAALAHAALWQHQGWLAGHLQGDLARERFHHIIGIYPQVAQGTPLADVAQRESDAYLDKTEADGSRRLYRVGRDWLRLVSRMDAKGQRSTGLLSEKPTTNFELYSDRETQGVQNRCSVIANAHQAPDGSMTADTLREDESEGSRRSMGPPFTMTPGAFYACSMFVKPLTRTKISLQTTNAEAADAAARFDLATGRVEQTFGPQLRRAYVERYANGFYRCVMIFSAVERTAPRGAAIALYVLDDQWNLSYTGQAADAVAVWGRQCEMSGFSTATSIVRASSYVPTDGSSAKRSADYLAYKANDGNFHETQGRIELQGLMDLLVYGTFVRLSSPAGSDFHRISINQLKPEYFGLTAGDYEWTLAADADRSEDPNARFALRAWWKSGTQGLATTKTEQYAEAIRLPQGISVLQVGSAAKPTESLSGIVSDVKIYNRTSP